MAARETIVHANDWITSAVSVRSASTFGLTLGEIRQFVAAADELAVPDKADVYFEGLSRSAVYVDQWSANHVQVKSQRRPEAE